MSDGMNSDYGDEWIVLALKSERWIPGAYIKVGMFGEDDADLLYHDDVHGSLLAQAEKTLDLIYFKYLKAKISYEDGLHRVEKFPFPREGLRELILNALVHKDYASNTPIQVSVYRDKIYVGNVGSLPESWSVKTLLGKHNSRPANPTIAGCIYLTGLIETWGRGIEKVRRECKRHGCPEPFYEVNAGEPGDLLVRLDAAPDALSEETKGPVEGPVEGPVAKAIVRCLVSKELRASEIAKCIGQNSRTGHFKRCMKDLIQRRIIESIGSKGKTDPTRKYRLSAAYCGR